MVYEFGTSAGALARLTTIRIPALPFFQSDRGAAEPAPRSRGLSVPRRMVLGRPARSLKCLSVGDRGIDHFDYLSEGAPDMSQSADVATKQAEVITRCRTESPTKCRPIPVLGLPG